MPLRKLRHRVTAAENLALAREAKRKARRKIELARQNAERKAAKDMMR